MKITDAKVTILAYENSPMTCLVELETDEGITGIGEADGDGFHENSGEFCIAIKTIIERGYRSILLGEDPTDYRRLWRKMYGYSWFSETGVGMAALSGVDIALVDLAGKALGVPACQLLGGRQRDRVRPYASHPWMTPERSKETCREVAELVEQGYMAIKVSFSKFLDFGEHMRDDIKYVKQIRDVVGYEVDLAMSDRAPNRGLAKAVSIAKRLEEYDLLFWEDALPRGDVEGYVKLTSAVALPIEAGEELTNQMMKYFITRRAVDVINPDISQLGGLSEGKKIADLAYALGVRDIPHSYCSLISVAANIQLTASLPDIDLMEYRVTHRDPSMTELLAEPFTFKDGYIKVPQGPGLGVELNREVLERISWNG